ncbi:hypothetical protein BDR26DRAFT_21043 [Obelidium mucronatum]|nr:hypothetical protein BDR26DRAFT_21043 [Obelidium mucronatum]
MARNQSVPISLARSNTRLSIGSDITTMTIATSTSSLSLESMPSMHSTGSTFRQAQSARYRATSHDSGMDMPVPRPSMASISTAGFMEANDPQLSLRFLLNQPNTMYGVVKRERPTKTWFGPKNTYTPYITALYGDKLIMYHASRSFLSRYKMASRQESINGPFYSAGSTIQFKNVDLGGDFGPRPSQTTSNPATPPQFSSSSLYQPPSYVLRLTVESEIHTLLQCLQQQQQ